MVHTKLSFLLLVSLSLTFVGCSTKQIDNSQNINIAKTESIELEDDLGDEFGDDFIDEQEEIFDPLYEYNSYMTEFNDKAFTNVLNPIATAYADTVPVDGRVAISNVFKNIKFPIRFVNNVLQLKIVYSLEELARFVINTTIGVLGTMDVAKEHFNLEAHPEDFGQTLGYYGVGSGFHVVIPLLGPSNVRDLLSTNADFYLNPVTVNADATSTVLYTGEKVNTLSLHLGEYESFKKDALDPYTFLRDAYEQRREQEIKD